MGGTDVSKAAITSSCTDDGVAPLPAPPLPLPRLLLVPPPPAATALSGGWLFVCWVDDDDDEGPSLSGNFTAPPPKNFRILLRSSAVPLPLPPPLPPRPGGPRTFVSCFGLLFPL